MSDFLKGNFKAKRSVQQRQDKKGDLNQDFERAALKRLGGSIAFVSKQGFVWEGDTRE